MTCAHPPGAMPALSCPILILVRFQQLRYFFSRNLSTWARSKLLVLLSSVMRLPVSCRRPGACCRDGVGIVDVVSAHGV